MADRDTKITFEDEDGLVTETDSRAEPTATKGGSSETTSAAPGYEWSFSTPTVDVAVAPAEPETETTTAVATDGSEELPENPTVAEVFLAAHHAALRGEEIQDGSRLDVAMKAAMEEIATGTNLGENPTPTEVFSQMREAALLGLEVPEDSPLQKAMDKVMEHIQTGDYLGDDPAPEEVFGAMRDAALLGLEVPEDSRLQKAMDKVTEQIRTGSTLGPNPSAGDVLAAARQAELMGLTPPPDSPLAMAMDNLAGTTNSVGTSSTTGFPAQGGVTSPGGTSAPGTQTTPSSSNNDSTETPVDRSDPSGGESPRGDSGSKGSAPATPSTGTAPEYTYTSPMGTTGVLHADGTTTITPAPAEAVPAGGDDEDPPPEDDDDGEEDPPPKEEEDDEDGMTDPDAVTSTTGLVAGIVVEPLGLDAVIFGSSTTPGGGATDGPRGDLDTANGTITGEVVGPRRGAGPDVDPDAQSGDAGRPVDPFHSGTGVGTVDGVRPDLLDAIGGGGAPEMDPSNGVNPYAAADNGDALPGTAPAHVAEGHDATGFGGVGDNAFGDTAAADLHIDAAFSAMDEDDPGPAPGDAFGGPLDDGFDGP
jgi:hypothetical protein